MIWYTSTDKLTTYYLNNPLSVNDRYLSSTSCSCPFSSSLTMNAIASDNNYRKLTPCYLQSIINSLCIHAHSRVGQRILLRALVLLSYYNTINCNDYHTNHYYHSYETISTFHCFPIKLEV